MTVPPFENRAIRGRILLLERPSVLREVQQLLLRSAGYETVAQEDPAVALGDLDLHRFDAAIVDGSVEGYVDIDFIKSARFSRPSLPILAVLWHSGPFTREELLQRGLTQVIEGAMNASVVIAAIDGVLGLEMRPATSRASDALTPIAAACRVTSRAAHAGETRVHDRARDSDVSVAAGELV